MSTRTIAVEHNGNTYSGEIASITSTRLGWEDHGILTAYLYLSWQGAGIGVGGFCIDQTTGAPDYDRRGTAYGLDHLMRLMETVGVDAWEKLTGASVVVLFDAKPGTPTVGMTASGIAGVHNNKVFILKEHAQEWRDEAAESAA